MIYEKLYSRWDVVKVRTSEDLLKLCPKLGKDSGWQKFACEFDNPECIDNRFKAAQATRKPPDKDVRKLSELCRVVRTEEWTAEFELYADTGLTGFPAFEKVRKDRIIAALELAKKVELLLGGTDEGARLLRIVEAEAKRRSSPPNETIIMEICQALLEFIRREERLPTKKELNIEANRLPHCDQVYRGDRKHGEIVYPKATRSIAEQYRVYDCRTKSTIDENDKIVTWMECRIVPRNAWDAPRWELSAFSGASTPSGLKGLPEAHKDKGRKVQK